MLRIVWVLPLDWWFMLLSCSSASISTSCEFSRNSSAIDCQQFLVLHSGDVQVGCVTLLHVSRKRASAPCFSTPEFVGTPDVSIPECLCVSAIARLQVGSLLAGHAATSHRKINSTRDTSALAIQFGCDATTSSWSYLGILSPRASSVITLEVILCKYCRHCNASRMSGDGAFLQLMLMFDCVGGAVLVKCEVECLRFNAHTEDVHVWKVCAPL